MNFQKLTMLAFAAIAGAGIALQATAAEINAHEAR